MTPSRQPSEHASTPLEAVLAAAQDGLVIVEPDGTISYANKATCTLLGLANDPTGQPYTTLSVPAITTRIEHCLAGARCVRGSTTVPSGDHVLSMRMWRTRASRQLAVSVRDDSDVVGHRHRIEAVLNATGDGLVVLSPDDVVTYMNPAAIDITNVRRSDVVGTHISVDGFFGLGTLRTDREPARCWEVKNCTMVQCPAYGSDDLRCWLMSGTLCEGPSEKPGTFATKRCRCEDCDVREANADAFDPYAKDEYSQIEIDRDDTHLVIKVRVAPIVDTDGDYMGRVIVLRDITPEYEIAQMKNEFVSTVSHELRTPLTSIKGYVDLILDGDAGEINEIQNEFLGIVKENSDRLVELINDMLDISRIESGRIHFKIQPTSIADIIDGSVDTFRAVLAQTNREIRTRVAKDLPPVAADPDRVGQVLINLISNAIKYSPQGGDVVVSAKQTDNHVRVSVRDQGLGISHEDQKRLFTKFYRVDSAMTRDIGGTGLGLSICKSIIELLGGEVGVRSKPGEGSTFYFTLPVAPPEMVRLPTVSGPAGAGATVLVVDRDEEIAALIETYLSRRGYRVFKAHTADEALLTAIRVKPDVITLDVILDEGDGFDLLQRLKDRPETAEIPVVVLSIVCDEGRSCRFGAANYLEKPIDPARLLDVVGRLAKSATSPLVLVVDDDRSIVDLLDDMLRRKGFAVAAAYDGKEALAAIEQRRPDVVLLDLRMPQLDGYEVIKQVKTHPEWGDIPIVVMTAYPIDSAKLDILDLTDGWIDKPLTPGEIAETVDRILAGKGIASAAEVAEPVTAEEAS